MIPLRDENPSDKIPFVTISIVAANALVFLYEVSLGQRLEDVIKVFAVTPYSVTHAISPFVILTLFTSLFFHAGFAHILGNMWYLWIFGNNIEDRLGHLRFFVFYILCGVAATFGHIFTAWNSHVPMIGASGAISGVLGAYILLYPRARVLVLIPFFFIWRVIKLQAVWFLGFWILLQFFYGAASYVATDSQDYGGVAWFAHIFGFLAGFVFLGLLLKSRNE